MFHNLMSLATIINDKEKTIEWLRSYQLVPTTYYCQKYKKWIKLEENVQLLGRFACRSAHKCHSISVTEITWFFNSKVSIFTVIFFNYCFTNKFTFDQTAREYSFSEQTVLLKTISDRFSYRREVCMLALDDRFTDDGKIRGEGVIVVIDMCKIDRRKYERRRVVEGSLVIGIIVHGYPKSYRLEISPNNKRNKKKK